MKFTDPKGFGHPGKMNLKSVGPSLHFKMGGPKMMKPKKLAIKAKIKF